MLRRESKTMLSALLVVFVSVSPVIGGQLYWNAGYGIARANPDGSGVEWVTNTHAFGVAVDPVGEHLYWNSGVTGGLWRADLDGNDAQQILSGWGQGDMTYTPEPATLSLLAVGLGAMAMRWRRGR